MFYRQQINQHNIPSKAVKHCWKRSVKPPLMLHLQIWNLILFKKRDLIINVFRPIPEVFKELHENTANKLRQFLIEKWDLFMLLLAYIFDKLIRWRSLWIRKLWFNIDKIYFESGCWRYIFPKHTSEDTALLSCWKCGKPKGIFPLQIG